MAEQNEAMEDFLFTQQLSLREVLRIFHELFGMFQESEPVSNIDISKHSGIIF